MGPITLAWNRAVGLVGRSRVDAIIQRPGVTLQRSAFPGCLGLAPGPLADL